MLANPVWYFYVCVSRVSKWSCDCYSLLSVWHRAIQTLPGFQYISHRAQHYICIITHGHLSIKTLQLKGTFGITAVDAQMGLYSANSCDEANAADATKRTLAVTDVEGISDGQYTRTTDIYCQNSHITVKRLLCYRFGNGPL